MIENFQFLRTYGLKMVRFMTVVILDTKSRTFLVIWIITTTVLAGFLWSLSFYSGAYILEICAEFKIAMAFVELCSMFRLTIQIFCP